MDAGPSLHESDFTLPVYGQLPFQPVRGEGVHLITRDGRRVLDLYGGHAVACLGYGHPALTEALTQQAATLLFQSNAVPLEIRARAARALVNFAPAGLERVFFVNSGAEANENALRIAVRTTGRPRVVALEGAFHGRTGASGAVTWGAASSWYGFPHLPFEVSFVSRDDPAQLLEAVNEDVAALIVEPVQGVAGAYRVPAELLQAARRATEACGSLLIFDEVQSGMGRSGYPFMADKLGIRPDMLTSAKSLAGGVPAGAVLTTRRLAARLGPGDLGTTFGGGPLACAAIEAVIGVIERDGLLAQVRRVSRQIQATCVVGPVTGIQGAGLLLGLRTNRPAVEIRDALLERDILTGTSADAQVLRLLPPLVLEPRHVETLASALADIGP
jgi:acetylornithine/succinyldiaminopimelate/putrescine aminotransferase